MRLQIDLRGGVPIYQQIVHQVKHLVASGDLSPGQQMPTLRQLAQQLRVNVNTVAHAYEILDKDGVISTQQGRGTFVAHHADEPYIVSHRRATLQHMIDQVMLEALSLGYSTAEVAEAFESAGVQWNHQQTNRGKK